MQEHSSHGSSTNANGGSETATRATGGKCLMIWLKAEVSQHHCTIKSTDVTHSPPCVNILVYYKRVSIHILSLDSSSYLSRSHFRYKEPFSCGLRNTRGICRRSWRSNRKPAAGFLLLSRQVRVQILNPVLHPLQ